MGFLSLSPESLHQITILFSDRGLPASYRHMLGFGSHTYDVGVLELDRNPDNYHAEVDGDTPHMHADPASVGIGVRLNLTEFVSLNPEIAHQVAGTATDQKNREHETRFLMSLVARF